MYTTDHTNQIASYTAKLLRDRFGKGPESIYVSVNKQCITMHLRNFIGPVEQFLLNQKEEQVFRYTRELMMQSLLPELTGYLEREMDIKLDDLYYDWGLHDASGIIVGLFADHSHTSEVYNGRDEVHNQINRVTGIVQKRPENVYSWWVNPKSLVVIREGLLILIEKEMIHLGYDEVLRTTKRKLEKRYFEEEAAISTAVGRKLSELYVDWDFERDKSVIVCLFHD
ncbi:Na-translocating system protein MpsC family protein [Paenibacillus dokdonensis]|uniref:Na-translocating system protein MpsC family protein n=1 Tax=Paenibacillus dokdonensis TaxID=2567944 RepID=A0ABU6GG74_9BACL|nr:Na-translocating system protein MpsC family protein [Paenibacillus dokdonensis]MEC0238731.1 Na-translocating system protein MpsC family protein [Paenibacillus dokdonensis]